MKYYTSTTEYNCGIDLHARQMYVCLMDRQGKKLVHCNVKHNDFPFFLMSGHWVDCGEFLDRAAARPTEGSPRRRTLDRGAGSPRGVQGIRTGLHTGPIESE